jgi:hypothetical protein
MLMMMVMMMMMVVVTRRMMSPFTLHRRPRLPQPNLALALLFNLLVLFPNIIVYDHTLHTLPCPGSF